MPARIHALLVVRPDGRAPAAYHLRRTLDALRAQSRPVDALTIILCGGNQDVRAIAGDADADVLTLPGRVGFASAARAASDRIDADAVWLLAQDTAPEPEALRELAAALDRAPSVGFVAPKLVRWGARDRVVSLGMTMTRGGRTVLMAEDELDQGQHDAGEDVLGADVRGILVRTPVWQRLDGLDPALAGADEGLDLGVRARLAGGRVALAPAAVVAAAGDGVAGLPSRGDAASRRRRAYSRRRAQLARRLAYASAWAAPLLWLSLLPVALWRTVVDLVAKRPDRVLPEAAAALVAFVRVDSALRSRARIRRARSAPWSRLAPLRATRTQLRHRLATEGDAARDDDRELHFFSGGGAWLVLGALVVSLIAFPALLAWPALGGGALAPLGSTVAQLWSDAVYGQRSLGWDLVGAADPFAGVVAVIGSLWPFAPSRALVVLWVLALPLAVLGAWFASTRLTHRAGLRALAAVAWALAPAFLAALTQGRPTGVLVHLLLPWLAYTAAVAHRSWGSAGAASVLVAAVVACAPSLTPALVVLWLAGLVWALVRRAGRAAVRVGWLLIPTAVLAVPLVWAQVARQTPWGLVADPGVVRDGPQAAPDLAGRLIVAFGHPGPDAGGWSGIVGPGWWPVLLIAPLLVAALAAPLARRWVAGIVLLVIAALGAVTAWAALDIVVSATGSTPATLWPGAGLSLAWAGLVGAAVLSVGSLDRRALRIGAAAVIMAALAVSAAPALTASLRGTTALTNGPVSTLPAYVDLQGRGSDRVATLVISAEPGGAYGARIVWGSSETLGGQSTLLATAEQADAGARATAQAATDLVTDSATDVIAQLAGHGVGFVLLAPATDDETDPQRTARLSAQTALDRRGELEAVGDTGRGALWRVGIDIEPRAEASLADRAIGGTIGAVQLCTLAVALLLAVPTRAGAAAARRPSRIVGERR